MLKRHFSRFWFPYAFGVWALAVACLGAHGCQYVKAVASRVGAVLGIDDHVVRIEVDVQGEPSDHPEAPRTGD